MPLVWRWLSADCVLVEPVALVPAIVELEPGDVVFAVELGVLLDESVELLWSWLCVGLPLVEAVFIEPVALVVPETEPDVEPPKVVLPLAAVEGEVLLLDVSYEESCDELGVDVLEVAVEFAVSVLLLIVADWFVVVLISVLALVELVVPYVVDVVLGIVVAVVVVETPVSGYVDDRVEWLQPLRINPRSAAIKTVFFIGGLSCAPTDRAHVDRFAERPTSASIPQRYSGANRCGAHALRPRKIEAPAVPFLVWESPLHEPGGCSPGGHARFTGAKKNWRNAQGVSPGKPPVGRPRSVGDRIGCLTGASRRPRRCRSST